MKNTERKIFSVSLRALFSFCFWIFAPCICSAADPRPLADEPLVDIKTAEPSIRIDLRYATGRNVTGHPIYPTNTPCLVRKSVAERLRWAQYILRQHGFGL